MNFIRQNPHSALVLCWPLFHVPFKYVANKITKNKFSNECRYYADMYIRTQTVSFALFGAFGIAEWYYNLLTTNHAKFSINITASLLTALTLSTVVQ